MKKTILAGADPALVAKVEHYDCIRKHKILPMDIEGRLPALYSQDGQGDDAVVHTKFFHPFGSMTWYALEYSPEEQMFYGWVENGDCSEFGPFSLEEIGTTVVRGLPLERDKYWRPKTLREVKASHGRED